MPTISQKKREVMMADAQARRRHERAYVQMRWKQMQRLRKLEAKRNAKKERRAAKKNPQSILSGLSVGPGDWY